MPVQLLGGLSVLVMADLQFGDSKLGAAISAYFLIAAAAAVPAGRFCDRWGPRRTVTLAMLATVTSLLGAAVAATEYAVLVVALMVGAIGIALAQPATNVAVFAGVSADQRGLAFGLKQSAVPLATLVAGLSLPAVGVRLGWRWCFIAVTPLVMAVVVLRNRVPTQAAPQRNGNRGQWSRSMVLNAATVTLAVSSLSAMSVFYVRSAVVSGVSASVAGLLLSLGSVASIAGRLGAGLLADRMPERVMPLMFLMMGTGAGAQFLLGQVSSVSVLAVVTVLAFGLGHGWNGLFHQNTVQQHPKAAGTASGVAGLGLRVGGIVGPVSFATVAGISSYSMAWSAAAAALGVSAFGFGLRRFREGRR